MALILWAVYFVVAFGARVWLHVRATGSTGLVAGRRFAGPAQALGELAEAAALALAVAAPMLALADVADPLAALDGAAGHVAGVALFVGGLVLIAASQRAMGDAWRIGVDPDAATDLVTHGPFAVVRNPIFTGLVAVVAGSALLVPSRVSVAAVALVLVSVELQVRFAEEPHLLRLHGARYADYAARAGRFLPGVGRLRQGRFAPGGPG